MRFKLLTDEEKKDLELHHRYEGDNRVADRIKAVLLKNEGWKNKAIAQALRIHKETVRQHLTDWATDEKLKPENGGSYSKLDDIQTCSLDTPISKKTYTRVIDICAYVEATFGVRYTLSAMTKWLIELTSMNTVSCRPDYVNGETTVTFFDQLKAAYPLAPSVHIILDQSGYHRSQLVRYEALKRNIVLHYLPMCFLPRRSIFEIPYRNFLRQQY